MPRVHPMPILGIDPGTRSLGVAVIRPPATLLAAWRETPPPSLGLTERIRWLKARCLTACADWEITLIVVEDFVSQGRRVDTWREMAMLTGALLDLDILSNACALLLPTALEWHREICGPMGRGKAGVRWILEQRCGVEAVRAVVGGLTKAQASHALDAAGLALWGADHWQMQQRARA